MNTPFSYGIQPRTCSPMKKMQAQHTKIHYVDKIFRYFIETAQLAREIIVCLYLSEGYLWYISVIFVIT